MDIVRLIKLRMAVEDDNFFTEYEKEFISLFKDLKMIKFKDFKNDVIITTYYNDNNDRCFEIYDGVLYISQVRMYQLIINLCKVKYRHQQNVYNMNENNIINQIILVCIGKLNCGINDVKVICNGFN